jgi:hypothetical protein
MPESDEALMPTRTLRMPRNRTLVLLLGACAFVAAGVLILPTSPVTGWVAIAFFGIGVIVFVSEVVRPSSLTLDADGFSSRQNFGRNVQRRWDECGPFRAFASSGAKLLFYSTPHAHETSVRRFNTTLAGGDEALRAGYGGVDANALAHLLNQYRDADARGHNRPVRSVDPYEGDTGGFPI